MTDLPQPTDGTSIATAPSAEASIGSTTDTGAPAPSDRNSLTIGPDGPILLHDVHFLNQMAHFNRERVPERNVHAKGSGAFGEFETTEDVSAYTKAALFQPGVKTEMLARFSTVAGEQGSPDTWRDPRGFALKFYTSEGNYDLVGNNTPVFFIRDTMKFPHFIRSQKRRGGNGLRDNNMQWDFWSLNPESAHQVTYLMGDRGIPKTYRHMNGYGSHTYLWINEAGEKHWVKYHFHSDQGVEGLTDEDGHPDRRRGRRLPPSRPLRLDRRAATSRAGRCRSRRCPTRTRRPTGINPFDLTKIWPHSDYPLIKVGTMTLNRNPENFFAQIEQAAFEPSALVPGIGFSPDKMLLGRAFAYADTHRHRIGAELPAAPGQPAARRGEHLHPGRADGLRAPRRRPGLRAELVRSRVRRRGRRGRRRLGDRRRHGASGLHAARGRRRLRARPARWSARSGTTRSARRSSRPSPATCSAASRATCSSAPSSTGSTSTPTPARRSRSWSAQGADAGAPGAQPGEAKDDASSPVVEDATHATT